jgi:hypothetical protein
MEPERVCVLEPANACLRTSCYQSLRRLECRYEAEQLVICGTVPLYYFKQMAQKLLRRCCPTVRVSNAVVVQMALASDAYRPHSACNPSDSSETPVRPA